ncbi:SDR family NAD(P)-dependent oxidoreductase [Paenibacillus sp. PL91]|uniref:SDR family NAD(P)-dependent oxidoreductase n=1 Tax=Paenibacillus sp. PL91 TaxID=2729538 RepID=UPI00145D30D1|nr:SDR family oxidoreductase [Paenibacillus sp. PL91]MBC9199240.1 SDR family oxidoreductase [Paenibacillus sp. PL91]
MAFNFTGKIIVVTGAASGIGRAIAIGFARAGAEVVASDIHEGNLLQLQEELKLEDVSITIQICNVSDQQEVLSLFSNFALAKGLDVFVHCAGITYTKHVTDTSIAEYRALIETNLSGTFYSLQHAVSRMKEHGAQGSIIVISSINAHRPLPSQAVYSSTKVAIESLVQSLAVEVAPLQIRVNCLAPGAVNTPLVRDAKPAAADGIKGSTGTPIPVGYMAEPEDMVGTVLFLASPLSSYMTGASLVVDGGLLLQR